MASRIAKATDSQDYDAVDNPLVRAQLRKKSKSIHNLIIHYTHEARLARYKKDIHQLWHRIFTETPITNTKLIVGNRNNRKCQDSLVRRCPQQTTNSDPRQNKS